VRVPLDSPPSARWSTALTAQLAVALTGHPAVGHLRLNGVVQGAELVLEGVETPEAGLLGPVLRNAIEAANRACVSEDERQPGRANMDPARAEEIARAVSSSARK
jgi:hypothetical protein